MRLPGPLQERLEALAASYFEPPPGLGVDFSAPAGAPALFAPDSVAWRVFKNPVALIVGGIAAVILELAEPRVRAGVWTHTSFRADPLTRMKRTGYAAMVSVYAPAEAARAMIARINRQHAAIAGFTETSQPYRADDPELLDWVQATASFGFVEAYRRFASPLSAEQIDRFHAEGALVAGLYGAHGAPRGAAAMEGLFQQMAPKLERSEIIFEFLRLTAATPILPSALKPLQPTLIRGAAAILPDWARAQLGLARSWRLQFAEHQLLRTLGAGGEFLQLERAPPAQACRRLGLAADMLYRRPAR